ncbi:MAG: ATP-binding protein, partial [Bdellovibrionaceae bacterium]|nr:ATP-binding protein [Pseudobdellovibrionaceae bacterium]
FVLNNLVQNAFAHGQAPVRIRLSESGEKIRITVEDQGSCEFDSIKTMSEAFVKSQKSQGMGLGLNIASTILAEWGSRLEFKPHPTSFAIVLRPCPPSQ